MCDTRWHDTAPDDLPPEVALVEVPNNGYWWPLNLLLQEFRPGSQGDTWTWEHEYDDLWLSESHRANCDRLATSMQTEGQRDPITLGPDGRVWDGHHRIVVAMRLGIDKVLCDTPPPAQTPPDLGRSY